MKPPIPDPFEIAQPAKKIVAQPVRWDERGKCFYVVYGCNTKGRLRCLAKHYLANPVQILVLFLLSPLMFGVTFRFNLPLPLQICLAAIFSVFMLVTISIITISTGRWSSTATVKLTQCGLIDEMPQKTISLEWQMIKSLKNMNGDLLFHVPSNKGCVFYRENFSSCAEADKFFEITHRLWKSNGADWDEVVRQYTTN